MVRREKTGIGASNATAFGSVMRSAATLLLGLGMLALPMRARAQDQDQPYTPGPAQRESSGQAFLRTVENEPQPAPSDRPKFQLTRWLEDWRALADPAKRTDPFDVLKYVPLAPSGDAHLTLSGQLREDLILQDGTLFADARDAYGLHRLYLAADLHVGQARIFAELADTLAIDKAGPLAPTDEDKLDVQLLFADYRIDVGEAQVIARVGRQEFAFDPTQRFVGVREGPNNRQAFDAARVNLKAVGLYISAFVSRPVSYSPGVFDDPRNHAVSFDGVYVTRTAGGQTQSVYVYRYVNDAARFGSVTGREDRIALGARVAGRASGFDYDVEGMRQSGTVGAAVIRAWGVGAIGGYTIRGAPLKPRLGIQADFASGDGNKDDGRVGTFNPLFFKGAYFTEAPLASFANIRHLKGSLSVSPSKSDTISLSYADFSKLRTSDAVYANPLVPLAQTVLMRGRHFGDYAQLLASHQFGTHLSLSGEAVRFWRSDALAAVGGRDLSYAKITLNFLF